MDSKRLLTAAGIGAAAMAYVALLIFRFDILSIYTIFFGILGGLIGVAVAYRIRFS
jgi:hypothetical protein